MEARHLLQKSTVKVNSKNVIHSNIFVYLNKDNMAPFTFHCEALPILEKKNNRFTYFFCRIFFLAIYNQSQTNGTQTLNICIRGMLFTALELCIWDYSNACPFA